MCFFHHGRGEQRLAMERPDPLQLQSRCLPPCIRAVKLLSRSRGAWAEHHLPPSAGHLSLLQTLACALSSSVACRHRSCSGSGSARQCKTLVRSLQQCSTRKVQPSGGHGSSGRGGHVQHLRTARFFCKSSPAMATRPLTSVGLRKQQNCYQPDCFSLTHHDQGAKHFR